MTTNELHNYLRLENENMTNDCCLLFKLPEVTGN